MDNTLAASIAVMLAGGIIVAGIGTIKGNISSRKTLNILSKIEYAVCIIAAIIAVYILIFISEQ
jgi:hypothetical protein